MATIYNPNSIVDVLKQQGQSSDMQTRAKLAQQYGLVSSPEEYYTKASQPVGSGDHINTALIAKLKGGTTGSMATPNAPVDASVRPKTSVGAMNSSALSGLQNLLSQTQAKLKQAQDAGYSGNQEIKYDEAGNVVPYSAGPQKPELLGEDELRDYARENISDTERALRNHMEAQKAQNDIFMNQELESTDLTIKHNRDLLYNSLAARGLLEEGATAGTDKLIEFENEANAIRQKVRDKWNVMNAGLSADLAIEIQNKLEKELERLRAEQKEKIEQYNLETRAIQEAKQQDIENELKRRELEIDEKYKNGQLTLEERNLAIQQMKANTDSRLADAQIGKLKAETGEIVGQKGAIQSETADMLSNIDNVFSNPLLDLVVGLKNPLTYWTPGSNEQQVKNQFNQIIASLSLENRKKLKGSGAISDFESRTLERASSALGKNLSNEAARSELRKVRGVMATANGLSADVMVKDPKTGESSVVRANRDQINNMIADGLLVEYK